MGLLLWLITVPVAYAAEATSMEDAIVRALAHSPEVAIADEKVTHTEAQLRSAKHGWFHPQVSVYAGDNVLTGTMRGGIQVTQDLDQLLTLNRDEVRQAQHALLLARQELALTKNRVVRQVHETWTTCQRLEALTHLRAQAVIQHERVYLLTQTQFDVGAVSLEQLLTTQQALLQAEQGLFEVQLDLGNAHMAFAQLVGSPFTISVKGEPMPMTERSE